MKRICRFWSYALLICVCLNLAGCSLGSDTDEDESVAEVENIVDLYNLIIEKAAQLAEEGTFEEGDIYVDTIRYGKYSQIADDEMLVLCKFKNNVHVAGLDRTLAIVFSQESMEVIAYKNFGADEVFLQCLPTETESKILFLGRTTYQGITTQYVELYAIQENEWVEISLDGVELQSDELCYITDDNRLIVVSQESGNYSTEIPVLWDEQTLYRWDEHAEKFVSDAVSGGNESKETEISEEILRRFMTVDLSTVEKEIPTAGSTWETVKCLAEIPVYDVTMYGYNDEEYSGRGVAIQIGEDVNYFDWDYLSPRGVLPRMYWDDPNKQLQVALYLYSGTGLSAQELHILQQHETGTLSDYVWRLEDYSSMLEERLTYFYDSKKQVLEIYDKEDNSLLVQADVSWLDGSKVEKVVAGDISHFWLGEEVWLEFTPGYRVEGWGAVQYDNMPTLEVQLKLKSLEEGEFELGEIRLLDIQDNVLEEDINQILAGSMFDLDEDKFQEMTRDEILDYYQIEMDIPDVLPDLTENSDARYGMYHFEDGSVFDQQLFSYQGEEGETLGIRVRKDKLPIHSLGDSYNKELKKAYIANHEVVIVLCKDSAGKDIHYAEFLADGLGISLTAEGLTYDEFILVLKYLN